MKANGTLRMDPGKPAPVYASQGMNRRDDSGPEMAAPSERSPQIFRALGDQERLISSLTDNLQMLAQRLHPIIPPQPPEDNGKTHTEEAGLCLIADQLFANNRQLSRISNTIATLMQIIEV